MKTLLIAVSSVLLSLFGMVQAAEPTSELGEDLAKRLISEILDIQAGGIAVASIIEGEKPSKGGFVERHVRRVTVAHPMIEEGRKVRRVMTYDFSWNPRYGWFYQEVGTSRSGEEVLIWSELEGELTVK